VGSTDQTRNVIESFCRRYPEHFRYLFEPKPGKSYALNAGIANARGEVLAFVDDDVKVEPTWLQNLTAELLNDGKWAGAGGRTLPAQKFTPPPWLSNDVNDWGGIIFAYFDQGNDAAELNRAPYGANMAFRRVVFAKYGAYRTDLGRNPVNKIGNEDTEFGRRVMAAGGRLRYEPLAIVYHPVLHRRITQEYFFSWWFDFGRAMIRERGDRPDVCGVPRDYFALLRRAAEIPGMTLRWMFAIHPQNRFRNKCFVWKGAGQFVELYRRLVDRKRTKAAGILETK
jgi:glycosyltransferase involved in cell wall biosynthesis